MAAHTTIQP